MTDDNNDGCDSPETAEMGHALLLLFQVGVVAGVLAAAGVWIASVVR